MPPLNPRLLSFHRAVSRVAGGIVAAVGFLVLAGWLFDIPTLKSILPGLATMKANTALAFMLAGSSLWLASIKHENQRIDLVAKTCAMLTILIGLLTLSEYIFSRNLGIDQFLFKDPLAPENAYPGRMSLVTALNFSLLGFSLLLVDRPQYRRLVEVFCFAVLLVAVLALIGYAYGIPALYQFFPYASVALHTVFAFSILCAGILFAHPNQGVMQIFSSDDLGGAMARRLLPAAIVIPFVLGWLLFAGQRAGLYDSTLRLVLFTVSNVIIFAILILWNARLLQRVEVERGQVETALSLTEQRSRALIENSWDAIALFGADGTILYGSPSTVQILGYELDEFVGRNAFELIHIEDQAFVTECMTLSLQQPGAHIPIYARVRHKNGEWRWLEGVFTNLLDEPSVQAIVNNYHDFTERKQAEDEIRKLNKELNERVLERTAALSQANNLLQMLLDNMPDQIYFKDAQSRFIRNSRSQAEALGLSDPAEAVGKSDFDFFPHAQLSYDKEQEIMRSGKSLVDEEERVVWPDGRETWVSTTKVPLPDQNGQIIGTFGISRDITERKRTEVALQKAKLELEAANKELEAFSYSVSHDLRSPLRSIDGFSQALLEDYGELLPPEGRNFLERVRSSAQRMADLIDDLLNLSKVTRASMKLVPVDLSEFAWGIVAELQRTQPERRVNFNITPNLKARGDPNLLQAVFENLLNNAWKFTSKQEQAEIEFGSKHENDETIYFIRDNGAGFDMAFVGKLFGAFQRLHATTEFSGTGIGLATVQRIINRHGGRIWAEGAVGQGATFFFTLPALERAKPEAGPQEKDSLARRVKEII